MSGTALEMGAKSSCSGPRKCALQCSVRNVGAACPHPAIWRVGISLQRWAWATAPRNSPRPSIALPFSQELSPSQACCDGAAAGAWCMLGRQAVARARAAVHASVDESSQSTSARESAVARIERARVGRDQESSYEYQGRLRTGRDDELLDA